MHIQRWHKAGGQQRELLYLNHQAAPLLKKNKDNFSNESGAVGDNTVSNDSFLPPFYNFSEKPEDPCEFVNEIYLKAIKVKEMQEMLKKYIGFSMKIVLTQQNLLPILLLSQTRKSQVRHPFRFQHSVPICHPRHLLLLIHRKLE